jgi:hypothetical protein
LKAVEKQEVGGKGVRNSNGRGCTNKSKVYSQWGYIKKTL